MICCLTVLKVSTDQLKLLSHFLTGNLKNTPENRTRLTFIQTARLLRQALT